MVAMSETPASPTVRDIARMIDHSLLHPTLTPAALAEGVQLARDCECATACVQPWYVPAAAAALADSDTAVCAVVGFPQGANHSETKRAEAERAIVEGAKEIDMVVNISRVLGEDWAHVEREIAMMAAMCRQELAVLKVIFENDYLPESAIVKLCEICSAHEVGFVKTSTGYGFVKQPSGDYSYQGATDPHLRLMRQHAAPGVAIKAAGGVRTLDDVLRVRELGVTRIGATATTTILRDAVARGFAGPVPTGVADQPANSANDPSGYRSPRSV